MDHGGCPCGLPVRPARGRSPAPRPSSESKNLFDKDPPFLNNAAASIGYDQENGDLTGGRRELPRSEEVVGHDARVRFDASRHSAPSESRPIFSASTLRRGSGTPATSILT